MELGLLRFRQEFTGVQVTSYNGQPQTIDIHGLCRRVVQINITTAINLSRTKARKYGFESHGTASQTHLDGRAAADHTSYGL